jgi:Kef-type K+ transport system membrane component KefB
MHYLNESNILLFLVQALILLGCARTLGALCEEVKIPALAGEILAGVLLGPTLLGRLAPSLQESIFPADQLQSTMLETTSWLGVFFLLLSSGFHVDVTRAMRSGRPAALIGIVGVVVPIAIGYPVFRLFANAHRGEAASELSFALFLAVAGSITAISVVARSLGDLRIAKSEEGSLALSACAINDVFGWFLFTVVMSIATPLTVSPVDMLARTVALLAFVMVSVTLGARILSGAVRAVESTSLAQPAATQTLVVTVGLLFGAVTQWLGIHAILGFFLAGTMVGSARGISDDLRNSLSDTMHAIFVPLFFATIGLKIDFLAGIELWLTVAFCAVAMGGKFFGAWLGARLGRVEGGVSMLMGLIFIPGGAMEIVVATLAMELRLINQTAFVAIVFSALLSSLVAGPLIGYQARHIDVQGSEGTGAP